MRSRQILFAVTLASLTVAAVFAVLWQGADQRARKTARWTRGVLDSLTAVASSSFPRVPDDLAAPDSLYWVWAAVLAQMQAKSWQRAIRRTYLMKHSMLELSDIREFQRLGLGDPATQIRDSLEAHPELIPFPGVLGGTMHFEPGENIVLLPPPLVYAEFEDGHIGGSMLLDYRVAQGGGILWKRLWARLQ